MAMQLKLKHKITAMCGLFLLPIAILMGLVVKEKNVAIDFSGKEHDGMVYQVGLTRLYMDAVKKRPGSPATEGPLPADVDKVLALDKTYGDEMKTTEALAAFKQAWQDYQRDAGTETHKAFVAAATALNSRVGDTSNLILDPDLDTYYMMDLTLLRNPSITTHLNQLQYLGERALLDHQLTANERTDFVVLSGLIQSDLEGMKYSFKVAVENEALNGVAIKERLGAAQSRLETTGAALLNLIDKEVVQGDGSRLSAEILLKHAGDLLDAVDAYYGQSSKALDDGILARVGRFTTNKVIAAIGVSLVTLLSVLGALFIIRGLRHVATMNAMLAEMASGQADLTRRLPVLTQDDLGDMAGSFNRFIEHLATIINRTAQTAKDLAGTASHLSASSEEVSAASMQVTQTISHLANGSAMQVDAVNQGVRHTQDMTEAATSVNQNVERAATAAAGATRSAEAGREVLDVAVDKVRGLHDTVVGSATSVARLGELGDRIGSIVEMIKGLANQTNLLALNAAIEAARAGENGRGFAVVAEEVRKLASDSSGSAHQITEMVQEIQTETKRAVEAMERGTSEADESVKLIGRAGSAFSEIVGAVATAEQEVSAISTAISQLTRGLQQVATSMDRIADVAHSSADESQLVSEAAQEQMRTIQDVTDTAQNLLELAQSLQDMVGRFRVDATTVVDRPAFPDRIPAHRAITA